MIIFLPENIWKNKKGFPFGKPANYLKVGYHTGQDFFTSPAGSVPVMAPCNGFLKTFPFSKSAGWWGYYKFEHNEGIYSLRIIHMYDQMKDGEYKEGEILGYCGATGLSVINGKEHYIGKSHEEQTSDKAVPHLHVELHNGEFKPDTNNVKALADERLIDPVSNFEKWINEELSKNIVTERNKIEEVIPKKEKEFTRLDETKKETSRGIWEIIKNAIKNWIKRQK